MFIICMCTLAYGSNQVRLTLILMHDITVINRPETLQTMQAYLSRPSCGCVAVARRIVDKYNKRQSRKLLVNQ